MPPNQTEFFTARLEKPSFLFPFTKGFLPGYHKSLLNGALPSRAWALVMKGHTCKSRLPAAVFKHQTCVCAYLHTQAQYSLAPRRLPVSINAITFAELSSLNTCLSSTPWLMAVSAVFKRSAFGQFRRLGESVLGPCLWRMPE